MHEAQCLENTEKNLEKAWSRIHLCLKTEKRQQTHSKGSCKGHSLAQRRSPFLIGSSLLCRTSINVTGKVILLGL